MMILDQYVLLEQWTTERAKNMHVSALVRSLDYIMINVPKKTRSAETTAEQKLYNLQRTK